MRFTLSLLRALGMAPPLASIDSSEYILPAMRHHEAIGRITYPALTLKPLMAMEQPLIEALYEALNLPSSLQRGLLTPVIEHYG